MRLTKILLIILAAAFIEAIVSFRFLFVRIEIILLVLIYFSLKVDRYMHAIYLGIFAGLLKDVIAISALGQHIVIFTVAALILNRIKNMFYEIPEFIPIVASCAVITFYSLVFIIIKCMHTKSDVNHKVIIYVLLIIFINSVISPLLFRVLRKCVW